MENSFEAQAKAVRDNSTTKLILPKDRPETSIVISITMSLEDKIRFSKYAKQIGLNLSSFARMAMKEYLANH